MADTEHDPSYALLWEVTMEARRVYELHLVVASATISIRLQDCFARLGAVTIRCLERP